MLPQPTADLLAAQSRRTDTASALALREWRRVGGRGDWLAQWLKLLPTVGRIVGVAQLGAARDAALAVGPALEESGFPEPELGAVNPQRFVGWTERAPLRTVLLSPVVHARMASGSEAEMLAVGGGWLARMVSTLVADAGRAAAGVQIAATERAGWVRYEPPPYCQRCAPLVGRWYRYSQGFQRHPQCPAVHRPASEREPRSGWSSAPDASEVKDLTASQRRALDEGADLNRVVNAHRRKRLEVAGVGNRHREGTPAWIYARAGDDRAAAVELLRRYGYLK